MSGARVPGWALRPDGTLAMPIRVALLAVLAVEVILAAQSKDSGVVALPYGIVGTILAIRRPANRVGWMLLVVGVGLAIGTYSRPAVWNEAGLESYRIFGLPPAWTAWLVTAMVVPMFGTLFLLMVTFPSGHLPARPWSRVVVGIVVVVVVLDATLLLTSGPLRIASESGAIHAFPNPVGILPPLPPFLAIQARPELVIGLLIAAMVAAGVSMVVRLRRAAGIERAQLLWVVASLVLLAAGFGGVLVVSLLQIDAWAVWVLALLAVPLPPIAVGVAVLRYRLYEIDRIVHRAVVYGAVTAILAGVFAAAITLSQRLFINLAGEGSDAAIVLTTLVVAATYAPVRKRVEGVVDRYLKYDQRRFGAYREELTKLLGLAEPSRAAGRLAKEALAETGARGVSVIARDGRQLATAGEWPLEVRARVEIGVDGGEIGTVLLGPDRRGHAPETVRVEALRDVADLAALASGATERPS